ncbi:energy transducer TonB [Alteraurantiacibacter aquimixticola]|uniref:TonB family protein n=1 Tax=Alteraurantiacibacter aquimixticola TaxID=2489173 RepID=A0A4T3FAE8_9SPHN|nr:energy transducer TonB [Alteraurantiacibacter aquimixticola]TIX52040.1 TonB family protein [Alteraurantiacibacter aquimixticola]
MFRVILALALGLTGLAFIAPPALAEEAGAEQKCGPANFDRDAEKAVCIKVSVNLEGRATDCEVAISSGDSAFDQQSCEMAEQRGRWRPALDSSGQPELQDAYLWLSAGLDGDPMAHPKQPAIPYRYPARARRNGEEGDVGIEATVGLDGRVRRCVVTQSSGSAILDDASCAQMTRYGRFIVPLDEAGNPTEQTFSQILRWRLSEVPTATGENSPAVQP